MVRANRHLERQLGQAARAAAAAVAGRAQRRTSSACRRPSSPTTRSPSCSATSSPSAATRSPRTASAAWNGVAILSRVGLEDVVAGIDGAPGFPHPEARAVAATCGGIRVVSVYVPNGREPDSEHYEYKLAWLRALRDVVAAGPDATVVCGDMNIAPTDADVFDPDAYVGQTHVTPPEREALAELAGARPARRRPRPLAERARVHLLGLPRRHVPQGPRHAHRPRARERAGRRARAGGMGRPARAQGQRAERPRAGDRRPRRGARRRHRPGRPAAVGARSPGAARRSCRRPEAVALQRWPPPAEPATAGSC